MTSDTQVEEASGAGAEDAGTEAAAASTEAAATAPGEDAGESASRPHPFWERYGLPLVLPLAVVVVVIALVLNISRIFLSVSHDGAVAIGTAISVAILLGAGLLSAAKRMSGAGRVLVTGGLLVVAVMFGWLLVGSAEEEKEAEPAGLEKEGGALAELDFSSTADLKFVPAAASGETGILRINLTNEGGEHTWALEDPRTLFPELVVAAPGDTDTGRAFFPDAGDYVFYCAVPGHRAAGMEGTLTVDGDPKTLTEAEAEVADGESA